MKRLSTNLTFRLSVFSLCCLIAIAALFWSRPYLASGAMSGTEAAVEQAASKLTRSNAVTVRATKRNNPWLKLQEGRGLRAQYRASGAESAAAEQALQLGQAEPVALASGDLNEDGYPDLVGGYVSAEGGIVALHLSNPEAFSPQKQETIRAITAGQFPEPFLPNVTALRAPAAADFVEVGDFDRDGKLDVITAARGGKELYLFAGDGSGALRAAQTVSLPGSVTALVAGDVNQTDEKADVAAAITGDQGASVLVYADAKGVHSTQPIAYPLTAAATELAVGHLDDDAGQDLAAVAGGEVLILRGREGASGSEEALGRVETLQLPFAVQTLALGEFIWDRESRLEIAVLAADGSVHIVARGALDTRPFSVAEMHERRRKLEEIRAAMENGSPLRTPQLAKALKWQVVEDLPASASLKAGDLSRAALVAARISSQPADDLLLMDSAGRKLQVLTKASPKEAGANAARGAMEFEAESAPVAVLPMRLNVLGISSLAVLRAGSVAPTAIMAAPQATFAVDRTDDNAGATACTAAANDCSLRGAIIASNANGVGADTITFTANTPTLTITSGGGQENAAATGDLDINGSLTVMGNGSATTIISTNYTMACGDCKVFGINQTGGFNGLSVSFSGVTIQNGFNQGTGTFFDTGGGVDFFLTSTGNTHSMSNCVVTNNRAIGPSDLSHGGGVNVDSAHQAMVGGASAGSVTFTSVSITNNTASAFGGGVVLAADRHDVTMTNPVVTGNTATKDGGGIWIRHSFGGTIGISGVSGLIQQNSGSQGGGISNVGNQVVNISDITINNNTATGTGVGTSSGGGLIVSNLGAAGVTGSTTLTGVTISNNHADNDAGGGGGISAGGFYATTLTNCTITGNTALLGNGGGVLNQGSTATPVNVLSITGGSIRGNSVTGNGTTTGFGGGFAALGTGSPSSSNTTFTNVPIGGSAMGQANSAVNGGGIANLNTSSTTVGGTSSILGNTATTNGGGIYLGFISPNPTTGNTVTINNNVPIGGTAAGEPNTVSTGNGGGVAVFVGSFTYNGVAPNGGTIRGNTSTAAGGGVVVAGGTATMSNLTVSNNSADSGGAFNITSGTLNVSLSRIVNNTANPLSTGIVRTGGTATVENNWWGCDGFPNATGCQTGVGTFDADPRIDLKVTPSPTSVAFGGTSTVTASFATNSSNAAINPFVMNGLPITFSATNGTMMPTMSTIASLMATSTFTNTGCGDAMVSATVDNGTQSATITFNKANSTTTITADMPDPTVTGQGYMVSFSVTGMPGPTPTGNVTVSDGTNSCMAMLSGGTGSCTLTSFTAGAKTLVATYAGDACFNGSMSAGVAHQVDKADTTTTITADMPDPSVTGQAYAVSVSLTVNAPGSGMPGGTITVSDGTGGMCTITLPGTMCNLTSTTAGAKTLTATYNGDANYNGSTSAGVAHQVDKANTTTTITADMPDPSVIGQSYAVTATVAVNPPGAASMPPLSGTVTVSDGTGGTCMFTLPGMNSCNLTSTSAGAKTLTAVYSGDANFNMSTSAGVAHQVDKGGTTTTITGDTPDPSVVGQPYSVSATVAVTPPAIGTPMGTITVSDGTGGMCTITLPGMSCNLTSTSAGAKTLTATYNGDTNFNMSTSAGVMHQVNQAATTTTITGDTPDPSVVGQAVAVNYSVMVTAPGAGTPTGNVTVTASTGEMCTGTVAAGTCNITFTTAGMRTLTAAYAGDSNFSGSSSAAENHNVNQAATTTTITSDSPDPSGVGQSVAINYSVMVTAPGAGTPTGNVTVTASTGEMCTGTVAAGTCNITFNTTGMRTLTAAYAGNANFSGSMSAAENHNVTAAGTTTSITSDLPDPSVVGQAVTVNYSVAVTPPAMGTPTGNVTVTASTGEMCTGTVAAGTCNITFTTAGMRTLTAAYAGDSNFGSSSSTPATPHNVNPANTTTSITGDTPDPSVVGQSYAVTATVAVVAPGSGTPTGTVTVTDGTGGMCTITLPGTMCNLTSTSVGNKTLTATYNSDGNFSGSSDTEGHQVNQAATTTTITADTPDPSLPMTAVTVSYSVTANAPGSGTPTGNVTVTASTGEMCTGTVAAGSCDITFNTTGTRTLTAVYTGDANYTTSTSAAENHNVDACAATLSKPDESFAANGGSDSFTVTIDAGCTWTATTTDPWITITAPTGTVMGPGLVSYTVASHSSTSPRSGTIMVAGQVFDVLQGAMFLDVPLGHPFYEFIGKLSARGITLGCGGGNFCPDANTTREQMAILIERALGVTNPSEPAVATFADVPNSGATDYGYGFIEDFVARGITSGCAAGPPRLYCPFANVTREQAAIFILRALEGGGYVPPPGPAMPTFADVPNSGATDFSYEFIEEFYLRGITSGCQVGPPRLYCPTLPVTRGMMAVFLVRAFDM